MIRRPPRSTRTDTRFPYTTLFRAIITNLDALHLSAERIIASGGGTARRDVKLPAVRNLAFATPLGMRELLDAGSGVLLGELSSPPSTSKKLGRASGRERVCPYV